MRTFLFTFLFSLFIGSVAAQPAERMIKIAITPNSEDWNYKTGQKASFEILVTQNSVPMKDVAVRYELSYDMMTPFQVKSLVLKEGKTKVDAGTMEKPGFLRCRVYVTYDGKEYESRATAGFDVQSIRPTAILPEDFTAFWDKAKAENAKIPIDARLTLLPGRCTGSVNVYELNVQNFSYGSRIYGILCVPKAPGKYPALLSVPGAGVRPYQGNIATAEKGVITLEIGIHGVPVTLDPVIYDNLSKSALLNYPAQNWDNRDQVYYKRVYLGCVRAIDYLYSMPEFDGTRLAVQGGSQGGALAIITASLDSRVKGLVSFYPALSDLTGYLHGRAGGWPHLFRETADSPAILEQKAKTTGYYDVVNFARNLKVPGFYSFGYNDMVCPPTSTFSAYNEIKAPKELLIIPEIAHYTYPEQWEKAGQWIFWLFEK